MSDEGPRTGAPRDVPPPRPVRGPARSRDGGAGDVQPGGLAAAARVLADAVGGLLDGGRRTGTPRSGNGAARGAAAVRDVVTAVATALRSARSGSPTGAERGAAGPAAPGSRAPGALLGDLLAAAAPRLPVRGADRLRAAYPGATDDEIADSLVERAARLTAGIGAATGGVAAAHWFAPPSLLAIPLELGAETLLTAAVEVVLVGELHELYGRPAPGDARARAAAYLASWSARRAVDRVVGPTLGSLLGSAGLRALRRRVTRRLAGAVPAAAPFLLGAAIAGRGNARATEALADRVLADLRAGRG